MSLKKGFDAFCVDHPYFCVILWHIFITLDGM